MLMNGKSHSIRIFIYIGIVIIGGSRFASDMTFFFFHFFLSFLISSYQEYFWLKVVILKLSERHTKMLENIVKID